MDDAFSKYPDVEIVADAADPVWRVKYVECVREAGLLRFVKHELRVPRERLGGAVLDLLEAARLHAKR